METGGPIIRESNGICGGFPEWWVTAFMTNYRAECECDAEGWGEGGWELMLPKMGKKSEQCMNLFMPAVLTGVCTSRWCPLHRLCLRTSAHKLCTVNASCSRNYGKVRETISNEPTIFPLNSWIIQLLCKCTIFIHHTVHTERDKYNWKAGQCSISIKLQEPIIYKLWKCLNQLKKNTHTHRIICWWDKWQCLTFNFIQLCFLVIS